jgi:CBS-domain-containing membrane protein
MRVSEVMSHRVVSVAPTALVDEAARLMLDHRISGLPVVDVGGNLVGMVTEGDFLRRAETGNVKRRPRWLEFCLGPGRLADEYVHTHGRKVEEVMTHDVVSVSENASLDEVVSLMEQRGIKRLPVLRGRQLVGIVSRANLLRALLILTRSPASPLPSDRAVHDKILAAVDKEPWGPRHTISVVVREGMVDLYGSIFDEREREALRVLVENISGVKGVRDHLVWIEPVSGMAFGAPEQKDRM